MNFNANENLYLLNCQKVSYIVFKNVYTQLICMLWKPSAPCDDRKE